MNEESLRLDDTATVAGLLESYLAKVEAGEAVDLDSFLAPHDKVAPRVRDCLESLRLVGDASSALCEANPVFPLSSEVPGAEVRRIGEFKIIREIGRGGMGVVYEAEQESLTRRVALKVLPYAGLLDETRLARFQNEARAAAILKHPNIVDVFFVGKDRGIHFYVMELIDGCSVGDLIAPVEGDKTSSTLRATSTEEHSRNGQEDAANRSNTDTTPLAQLSTQRSVDRTSFVRSVAKLGVQAANALHYAHEQRVVHRDVKPSNLLLDHGGKLHVADFGLARFLDSSEDLTLAGDVIGTLRYMSPEQANGELIDHRTDVYSLGLTLYELLVGRPAFQGKSRPQLLKNVVEKSPPSLSEVEPKIPRDLQTIVEKAYEKTPADRYQSANQLADDLRRFLDNRPIKASRASTVSRGKRFVQRNPAIAALLATTTLLFGALAIGTSAYAWKVTKDAEYEAAVSRRRELELYARDMQLAAADIDNGSISEAEHRLRRWVPDGGRHDDRGFEWFYLWKQCHPSDLVHSIAHQFLTSDVAFSPDGTRVAEAFMSDEVPIWSVDRKASDPPLARLECKAFDNYLAKTFPEQNLLVVGSKTGDVYLWDWENYEPRTEPFKVQGDTNNALVCSAAVSPDGKRLAIGVGGDMGKQKGHFEIHSFRARSGDRRRVFVSNETHERTYAYFRNDGKLLVAVRGQRQVEVRNADGDLVEKHPTQLDIIRADVSRDRNWIAIAQQRGFGSHVESRVEVRRLRDWVKTFEFRTPDALVRSSAFSSDNQLLAVGDQAGYLWIADLNNQTVLRRRRHEATITSVNFSPHDKLLASTSTDKFTHLFDVQQALANAMPSDGRVRCRTIEPMVANAAKFVTDDLVATTRTERFIDIWHSKTGEHFKTLKMKPGVGNMVHLSVHQGRGLLAACQMQWPVDDSPEPGAVTIWNIDDFTKVLHREMPHELITNTIPFSHDGRFLAVYGGEDLSVLDLDKQTLQTTKISMKSPAFSRKGHLLACALDDGVTCFLDPESLREVRPPLRTGAFAGMRFLPDSNLLAVSSLDHRIKIWDIEAGTLVRQSASYPDYMASIEVSPDGSRLAVGGCMDGKYRIFRTETLDELLSFDVPPCFSHSGWSPSGDSLVIAGIIDVFVLNSADRRSLSRLNTSELHELACQNMTFWNGNRSKRQVKRSSAKDSLMK